MGCARPGRSNLHNQERIGTVQRLRPLVACCARGRAHTESRVRMRSMGWMDG